jgi:hypothetical protein
LLVHDLQYSELAGAGETDGAGEPDGSADWPDPATPVTGAAGPDAADAARADPIPGAAG